MYFFKLDPKYKILKKNAPIIYEITIGKEIKRLELKLKSLREDYAAEKDKEKRVEIQAMAEQIKKQIKEYD